MGNVITQERMDELAEMAERRAETLRNFARQKVICASTKKALYAEADMLTARANNLQAKTFA